MKIPVVLSTVVAAIDESGQVVVDLDGERYAPDRRLERSGLRAILDEITSGLATAVRVEVREADGSTYSDIALPPDPPASAPEKRRPVAPDALAGAGFQPGEEVALAYVVARHTADRDGSTSINLPPALLGTARSGLVMLGMTSLKVAPIEVPG